MNIRQDSAHEKWWNDPNSPFCGLSRKELSKESWNAALEHAAKICELVGPKEGSMKLISNGFAAEIRKEISK